MLGIMAFIGFSIAFILLLWICNILIDVIGERFSRHKG